MTPMRLAVLALVAATPLAIGPLAAPAASHAQGIPSANPFRGFQPSSDYSLVVGGKLTPAAEIYLSERIPALLILTSKLPSPVMLTPRTGRVDSVNLMKVSKQKDGSIDLFADAVVAPIGQFVMEGKNITFTFQQEKVSLVPRPPLLGLKKNADLKSYLPEYVRGASGYTPNAAAVADLRKRSSPAIVRVFFGSWCSHCRQHVPPLLKVEDEVRNPRIQFEYYGLPTTLKDPVAQKVGVRSVPTGIVYVNGKEVGRIDNWSTPEVALDRLLAAPAARGK
jgi:thiol-disulfide isomerase/thioredoxin